MRVCKKAHFSLIVKSQLNRTEFVDLTLVQQGKRLVEAQSWVSVLDHAVMAWTYVRSTPVWDNAPHNNARRQCFKALAANALQAIKKGVWTAETAADVRDR